MDALLIILGGLPGVGKTTIARELARVLGAVHLRIDSIELALRDAGGAVEAEGYLVAYAVAADNLRAGRIVIADCVNPWPLTRAAWRDVAVRAGARVLEAEILCADRGEHRRRVEARAADSSGHRLPTWQDVIDRDYRRWDAPTLKIDTSRQDVDESVKAIALAVQNAAFRPG